MEALDIDILDVSSDLDKTGDVEGKKPLDKKGYFNDEGKEGAIGDDGMQASDNLFDMNAAKGYSDKSGDVDGKGIEGSVVGKDNYGESNINAAKETVVTKSTDVNDKSEEGAMVGDYYKNDGGDEVVFIDRNDLGLGARDDIANADTNEIDKLNKKRWIGIGFGYSKDGKVTLPKKMYYDSTALSRIHELPDTKIMLMNYETKSLSHNVTTYDEIDQKVMEIVIEFCKYRLEFCTYDLEKMKTVKTMLTEEERVRYGIPEGAIPTMDRGVQMEPSGKILKPKRFYADSSFYIFSFWLYLCLRFIRARLNEVLQEIDNKPNDAQV